MQIQKSVYAYPLRTCENFVEFLDLVCDEPSREQGYSPWPNRDGGLHTEVEIHIPHMYVFVYVYVYVYVYGYSIGIRLGFQFRYTNSYICVKHQNTQAYIVAHYTHTHNRGAHVRVLTTHLQASLLLLG